MAEQKPKKLTKEERALALVKKALQTFVNNAVQIIYKAAEIVAIKGREELLDKMLHGVFFLGHIHDPWFSPEEFFDETDVFKMLRQNFPNAFGKYKTDVAVRTPFSYFLELVVSCGENLNATLSDILQGCKGVENERTLISSVICVCKVSGRSYYGASLSCATEPQREIITAVSCFHVWDNYVCSAVLDVFPEDKFEPRFPGGNMRLPMGPPLSVECIAYGIENLSEVKPPCARCHSLYSLPNPGITRSKPGNCAETEAISNLLKNEKAVKDATRMQGEVFEREVIKTKMRSFFEGKMKELTAKRGIYKIDQIY